MYNIEFVANFCHAVSSARGKPSFRNPTRRTFSEFQMYVSNFSESQLKLFLTRLPKSKWFNNDYFSWTRVVSENIIATVIAGDEQAVRVIQRYYRLKQVNIANSCTNTYNTKVVYV